MKRRIIFASLIMGMLFFVNIRMETDEHESMLEDTPPSSIAPSFSMVPPDQVWELAEGRLAKEAPRARAAYERLRLQNPQTQQIPEGIAAREANYVARLPRRNTVTRAISFSQRGPFNLGGRTRALAYDVSDPAANTLIAGGVSGGMWRSTDRGQTWTRTTRRDQLPNVVSLFQDQRAGKTNVWYAGTGELVGNSATGNGDSFYQGDGIFRSTNGGQSWEVMPETQTGDRVRGRVFSFVNSLVVDPTNTSQDEIYAAVLGGIVRTTNDFQNFTYVLGSPNNFSQTTEVAITPSGRLYATVSDEFGFNNVETGIWTSTNGTTWTEIVPPGGTSSGFQRTSIGISPSNEDIVYFLRTDAGDENFRLFHYNAQTNTLTERSNNIPNLGGSTGDFTTQGSYDQYVLVHPANSEVVYLGGTNIYRSTNGFTNTNGTQWIGGYSQFSSDRDGLENYFRHHPDQHALAFDHTNPNRMVSAHDGGLSITNDNLKSSITNVNGANGEKVDEVVVVWESLNRGYFTTQLYALAIEENNIGDPVVVAGMQDNSSFATFDANPQDEWIDLFGGDGSYCEVTHNSIMVSAQFAQMVRYAFDEEDGSFVGSALISPPNGGSEDAFLFVNAFIADPVIPNRVYVGGNERVYYTDDIRDDPQGNDWQTLGTTALQGAENVSALAASTQPAHVLYIGTARGRVFKVNDTNQPEEPTEITGNVFPANAFVNSITVDPRDANHVFVVFSSYEVLSMFETTDGGDSWTAVSGNLEENNNGSGNGPSVRWLEMIPDGEGYIYLAGTSHGLFTTTQINGMNTNWELDGVNSIGNVVVDMIEVRPVQNLVMVGTHGNGVFSGTADGSFQANIYLTQSPCDGGEATIVGNRVGANNTGFQLRYEWLVNGQLAANVSGSGIILSDPEAVVQLRLTNTSTGEVSLSNIINLGVVCGTVSSRALDLPASAWRIYPNPVTDILYLESNATLGPQQEITIYDIQGKQWIQDIFTRNSSKAWDLKSLPAGNYVIELSDGEKRGVKRFVKR